jgi:histidine ammonia-lyase
MGYNASKKALKVASNLQYILAIELLSVYNAHQFMEEDAKPGSASSAVLEKIQETVPALKEDIYLYPHLENLKCLIHSGELVDLVETKIGQLL